MDFPSNSLEPSGTPKVRRPIPSDDQPEVESPVVRGEKKVVKKVVAGQAIKRKKGFGSRFREAFGGGDGKSVVDYVVFEVLGPAFKDMIADAVISATERAIFGEARHSTRRTGVSRGPVGSTSHISYNRYSTAPREAPRAMGSRARSSHDFGEIELQTRAEAEEVIAQMDEIIDRFQTVSVADLFEMVGEEAQYTDEKWGWTDMRGADVRRTRGGTYILVLPRTEPIG